MTKLLPFIAIVVAILIFFYPVWLQNKVALPADIVTGGYLPWLDYNWGYTTGVPIKNPIASDSISFIYPMRMLAIDLITRGELPLWNSYILSGTPLLANFQSAPFSPTNIYYFLFDRLTAWNLQIISQHLIAAIACYFLLRHWRVGKKAAIFGSLIFAFSGFNLLWSQWNAHTLTAAFLPLLILFSDKWFKNGSWKNGLGISFFITLQLLSGYPQLVLYSLLSIFLLVLLCFQFNRQWFWKLSFLGIYLALGFGMAALQLFPAYELINLSQRSVERIPLQWVFLDPRETIAFLAPDFFGNHATQNYWGYKNYLSTIGFVGVVALIFALLGLSGFKVNSAVRFAGLLGIVSLLLSFPTAFGIFIWESNLFGSEAGVSYRSLVLFAISVSLLAGIGMDEWIKGKRQNFTLALIFPLSLIAVFTFFLLQAKGNLSVNFLEINESWKINVAFRNLILPSFVLFSTGLIILVSVKIANLKEKAFWLVFILAGLEIFYFGWKFTPFSDKKIVYPNTPIIDFLQEQEKPFRVSGYGVMPVNQNMPAKLEFPGGYDAVYPLSIAKYIAVANSSNADADPQDRFGIFNTKNSPLLNLANTKYFLVKSNEINLPEVFKDKSVTVLQNTSVLPRAFLAFDWEYLSGDEALEAMLNPNYPVKTKVLLENKINLIPQKGEGSVNYLEYKELESILKTTSSSPALLFVSDTWYPGWKAYVDGNETNIHKANFAFRAIEIPEGEHTVRMSYEPDSFKKGMLVSGISFGILVLLSFALKVIGKQNASLYT